MKSRLSITCIFLFPFLFIKTISAQSINEIFDKTTPITFLGVDFSNAKYYGRTGTVDTTEMVNLFVDMNKYIVFERKKYDIGAALKKDSIIYSVDFINALNKQLDKSKLITNNIAELNLITKDSIKLIVNRYKFDEKTNGIGLVLIVDNLFKRTEDETLWVTFFDMQSKKVLLTERAIGLAEGYTFRYHWVKPVYQIIEDMKYGLLKSWKKKYLSKK